MSFSLLISMFIFALAASLSPGPVNLLSLSSSATHGLKTGLIFITGATLGFILLFVLIGFGLHYFIDALPWITQLLQWLGISFLLYLSYQLFKDSGELSNHASQNAPSFMTGAIMQWLNPKAWLASVSGISTYIPQSTVKEVAVFAWIYLPTCWLSLAVWVIMGGVLGQYIQSPSKVRLLNRTLALMLAGSCFMLVL
ncbi:LysE family translocator [Marinomonas sp. C2222]|uniref:LysE family translocator n=1 Tax=Marinomonas sargassi TaxID=2984494 RepID=A0ABT2YPA1_9GAMM|nr:LysE family translocator [Marinomonas sargassi]MCV2401719.1 LysE family translocator [Marinomonas sargassi]